MVYQKEVPAVCDCRFAVGRWWSRSDVSVKEAEGSVTTYPVPYAAVPIRCNLAYQR
ncbi:hypothetical protein ACNKHU_12895 [Shigella flexneri]